jgi:hypothetical protein
VRGRKTQRLGSRGFARVILALVIQRRPLSLGSVLRREGGRRRVRHRDQVAEQGAGASQPRKRGETAGVAPLRFVVVFVFEVVVAFIFSCAGCVSPARTQRVEKQNVFGVVHAHSQAIPRLKLEKRLANGQLRSHGEEGVEKGL